MEAILSVIHNWLDLLSAVGIVGGLVFTAVSLRSETKTRKASNLIALTSNHREIWNEFFARPDLARILKPKVNLAHSPVSPDEEVFVNTVILHLSCVYETLKDELLIKQEGLRRDVASFLALPIPAAVWERTKLLQNRDFVVFVEECRTEGHLL